jgi:hypothetical protein
MDEFRQGKALMKLLTMFAVTVFILVALAAFASASPMAAAGPSFSGNWKLNYAKSQLTGQTITLSRSASGGMHFDTEGFAYDFDLNRKEYPTPDGGTIAYRAANATTWEITARMKGKVIATYRLSINGDLMTTVTDMMKPDGGVTEQTGTMTRISGGPGFLGRWKSTGVKGASPSLEITTEGQNGITLKSPEGQTVCTGSFDGKDYPLSEAGVVSKETLAFIRTGPNAFKMTTKLNGKPYYVDVFTLSADGKTLTDDGNAVSANEPIKSIYDKQ